MDGIRGSGKSDLIESRGGPVPGSEIVETVLVDD